jgi:hypothetical protein
LLFDFNTPYSYYSSNNQNSTFCISHKLRLYINIFLAFSYIA